MSRNKLLLLSVSLPLSLSLSIASCGKKSSDSNDAPAPQGDGVGSSDLTVKSDGTPAGDFKAKMAGKWVEECVVSTDSDGKKISTRKIHRIGDGIRYFDMANYSDTACKNPILAVGYAGTYSIIGSSENHAGGFKLESEFQKIQITLGSLAMVNGANKEAICGITDWKINVTRVVDTSCEVVQSMAVVLNEKMNATVTVDGDKLSVFTKDTDTKASTSATR